MGLSGYMAAGMAVMVVLFGLYFKMSQNEIAQLQQDLAISKVEASTAKANNVHMRNQIAAQTAALSDLAVEQQAVRKESLRVSEIFAKHDLARLASKKPQLIENRVNSATKAIFDEFERIQ